MSSNFSNHKLKFIVDFLYAAVIALIVYFTVKYTIALLYPFVIAAVISIASEPAVRFMTDKLRFRRAFASVVAVTFVIIVAAVITFIFSATLFEKAKEVYNEIPAYTENIKRYFEGLQFKNSNYIITPLEKAVLKGFEYVKTLDIYTIVGGNVGGYVFSRLSGLLSSLPSLTLSVIITFAATVFVSVYLDEIKAFLLFQLNDGGRKLIIEAKRAGASVFKKYAKSYLSIMLITFCELTLFFLVFNIRPAASLALIISAVDILPVLGVGTVMIPWALFSLVTGDMNKALILIAIYAVITVVRQMIEPKIIGNNIGLHPVATLISVFAGLKLFGIAGMFLAPVTLIVLRELQQKGFIHIWNEKTVDNGKMR